MAPKRTKRSVKEPSFFEWKGDAAATTGWTVIGEDEDGKRALVDYDSFYGASSQPLDDGIPGQWLMPREKAEELHDRINIMDKTFWPGFNPTVARVENGEVVELVYPPEPDA